MDPQQLQVLLPLVQSDLPCSITVAVKQVTLHSSEAFLEVFAIYFKWIFLLHCGGMSFLCHSELLNPSQDTSVPNSLLPDSPIHFINFHYVISFDPDDPFRKTEGPCCLPPLQYRGQANLHVFEDWCGSSTDQLRKNIHYPLYPHSRMTVRKLAISPMWSNYGLRIYGYLHPYVDGYLFAVASDDNSEFWLSIDESPLNVQLLAYVGKVGAANWNGFHIFHFGLLPCFCVSHRLSAKKRYFFEIIHKQNDKGTDHVEVVWRLNQPGTSFTIIGSEHISLYTSESQTALKLNDVGHIPQSAASHVSPPRPPSRSVDMLRDDPRDSFYEIPLINETYVRNVLPKCSYTPSYTIKGFPLLRYQGLQFVHLSFVYPNDYTRLTHMETDNKCFYHENPRYLERFGFFNYMKMDIPEIRDTDDEHRLWNKPGRNSPCKKILCSLFRSYICAIFLLIYFVCLFSPGYMGQGEPPVEDDLFQYEDNDVPPKKNKRPPDYGDDYDNFAFGRKRKLLSEPLEPTLTPALRQASDPLAQETAVSVAPVLDGDKLIKAPKRKRSSKRRKVIRVGRPVHLQTNPPFPVKITPGGNASDSKFRLTADAALERKMFYSSVTPALPTRLRERLRRATSQTPQGERLRFRSRRRRTTPQPKKEAVTRGRHQIIHRLGRNGEEMMENPERNIDNAGRDYQDVRVIRRAKGGLKHMSTAGAAPTKKDEGGEWGLPRESEVEEEGVDYEMINPALFDPEVNWGQTFEVNPMDLQVLRSDWIDLQCNVSGNLLLKHSEALPVVEAFMRNLNQKNPGRFSLLRVVNIERRPDGSQGSRYLLELELRDQTGARLRLSEYVYMLHRRLRQSVLGGPSRAEPVLCSPMGLAWNPSATVHFIVPVKNQARWVQQFITDMESLYRTTGDKNFNVIVTDFGSTDMNVELVLRSSSLPRHQYVRMHGNFERSAGLQAGIDLITDDHSIVFLCDLHIHFPPSIIDTIRKHCVEGKMAFAPIVMRLNCGATPQEPIGFWEVNGFGLLGIYKSDLDAAGGMNTEEFRDRWGGEDWELLDRILEAGLEVERIYIRKFMHHYHSRRGMWNRQSVRSS
uniref:Beta-1,4-N-acetylgalactosaminyltransferase n=2 Tax=Scleropages formosus TaxID=113540 RepID=A0A8C9VKG9_SCLFO